MNNILYTLKFFLAPVLFLMIVPFSFTQEGYLSFLTVYIVFGLVPVMDLIFPKSVVNPVTSEEEQKLRDRKIFDVLVWIILPIQVFLLVSFFKNIQQSFGHVSNLTLVGRTLSMGMACGILGINVGHELGHRVDSWQRFVGKALLLTSLRMTFYVEHNWGHHKHVSTPSDPASAKKNELVYTFIPKSIFLTWLNGWKIQKELLNKEGKGFFSIKNDVFWYEFIQWGLVAAIALFFGIPSAVAFLGAAIVGMILLELVNYIEHYGLRREVLPNGSHERTLPIHSWNSVHSFSGAALFNLSRHSDHHFIAERPYHILRNYDVAPNMPTGYAGMILVSLVPPLWFWMMNKKVDSIKQMSPEQKRQFTPRTV